MTLNQNLFTLGVIIFIPLAFFALDYDGGQGYTTEVEFAVRKSRTGHCTMDLVQPGDRNVVVEKDYIVGIGCGVLLQGARRGTLITKIGKFTSHTYIGVTWKK